MTSRKQTVSLVLGSGGARGHAHIGVIKAIEERELRIHNIAGSSMGAVIGGVYATGELDTYIEWAESLSRRDVVRLLDFSFTSTSIFKGERIFETLKDLVGERLIEELDTGFTAVATDIDEQREIWLKRGPLFTAMRASTAVPGVFAPVELNERTLVDGGLVNPIPIAPTLNDATDLTIAVNLNSITNVSQSKSPTPKDEPSPNKSTYQTAISEFLDGLLSSDSDADAVPDAAELLTRSIDVMQGAIARLKLAAYTPDVTVEIPRNACAFFEFHRAGELRDLGYSQANEALDKLGC